MINIWNYFIETYGVWLTCSVIFIYAIIVIFVIYCWKTRNDFAPIEINKEAKPEEVVGSLSDIIDMSIITVLSWVCILGYFLFWDSYLETVLVCSMVGATLITWYMIELEKNMEVLV